MKRKFSVDLTDDQVQIDAFADIEEIPDILTCIVSTTIKQVIIQVFQAKEASRYIEDISNLSAKLFFMMQGKTYFETAKIIADLLPADDRSCFLDAFSSAVQSLKDESIQDWYNVSKSDSLFLQ